MTPTLRVRAKPSLRPRTSAGVWLRATMLVALCFLALIHLDTTPRPWHDEGGSLSLAKTLAEDGVYAVRTSDGYQTFGFVQSVGPLVVLPIAASFRLFGAGLLQG